MFCFEARCFLFSFLLLFISQTLYTACNYRLVDSAPPWLSGSALKYVNSFHFHTFLAHALSLSLTLTPRYSQILFCFLRRHDFLFASSSPLLDGFRSNSSLLFAGCLDGCTCICLVLLASLLEASFPFSSLSFTVVVVLPLREIHLTIPNLFSFLSAAYDL